MHHYYLSFYGQTNSNVHDCMRRLKKVQPLIKGYVLLPEPHQCGPNPASHTVDLWFNNREDCVQATTTCQLLAQAYLPYAVGRSFIPNNHNEPLDLTPDLMAFPKSLVPQDAKRLRVRPILHMVS